MLTHNWLTQAILAPLWLKPNFDVWSGRRAEAAAWLIGSILIAFGAQVVAGDFGVWTAAIGLLNLTFVTGPTRLVACFGALCIAETAGEMLIHLLTVRYLPDTFISYVPAGLWKAWCFVALTYVILRYLQAPKKAWKAKDAARANAAVARPAET